MNGRTWQQFYQEQADQYEQLIRHEDYEGQLLPAIAALHPLSGADVVEFGAGTGRVTRLIAPLAQQVLAVDLTPGMVREAQTQQRAAKAANWHLCLGDSRAMPVAAGCADLAIQGWSFLQIAVWHEAAWAAELDRALREMMRVLRPGGTAVLIETLGTGHTTPTVPPHFAAVYDYLEQQWGFTRRWIRTDYRFPTRETAAALIGPLFGAETLDALQATAHGFVLPECTGLWQRRKTE